MAYQPAFTITNTITAALARIERLRGFLEAAHLSERWITEMQERAFVLEAHHTTHIEGTRLSLEQSERLLIGDHLEGVDPNDRRELLNYRRAFEFVSTYLDSGRPVMQGLIRDIHSHLVEGVRGNAATPGEYRQVQNYVVNSRTQEVIYTPPPAYEVPRLMAELVDWLGEETAISPILVAGLAQFQLVDIHPFLDGNGRSARLLSSLCLYRSGYDFKRLFSISEYYDRDRIQYYQAIQAVRESQMDLTAWLEYFVSGLEIQLQEVEELTKQMVILDALVVRQELSKIQQQILQLALHREVISLQEIVDKCPKSSRRTLQREIKTLVDRGLLIATGATTRRLYRVDPNVLH